jgi:hypothetical protein
MALPFGPPLHPKAEAARPQWQDPQEVVEAQAPQVYWLSIWAMTKLPWHGKESASSHKVFITTKLGETVSVDQMESTKVGFFAHLKGTLTKTWYRYCTVFVDHYFQLCFVHLQVNNSAAKTILPK